MPLKQIADSDLISQEGVRKAFSHIAQHVNERLSQDDDGPVGGEDPHGALAALGIRALREVPQQSSPRRSGFQPGAKRLLKTFGKSGLCAQLFTDQNKRDVLWSTNDLSLLDTSELAFEQQSCHCRNKLRAGAHDINRVCKDAEASFDLPWCPCCKRPLSVTHFLAECTSNALLKQRAKVEALTQIPVNPNPLMMPSNWKLQDHVKRLLTPRNWNLQENVAINELCITATAAFNKALLCQSSRRLLPFIHDSAPFLSESFCGQYVDLRQKTDWRRGKVVDYDPFTNRFTVSTRNLDIGGKHRWRKYREVDAWWLARSGNLKVLGADDVLPVASPSKVLLGRPLDHNIVGKEAEIKRKGRWRKMRILRYFSCNSTHQIYVPFEKNRTEM